MASTFMGLNIGSSALSTYQTAVNTTANNIANVKTEGYTRQTTEITSTAALRISERYGSVGTGVEASKITQTRSVYYDTKYWENNSSYGLFEQKLYYLDQIQGILKDDSTQNGFSTIFANMFNALDSVITGGPSDVSARNQFINKAQSLCTYFNALYTDLQELQKDCNEEIKTSLDSVNAMSEKLALLNKEIYNLEVRGGTANQLRDERNSLLDQLSTMVKVETAEVDVYNTNGENLGVKTCRIFINGQVLVDGFDHRTLEITSTDYKNNQCDIDGLYDIVWSDTKMDFAVSGGTAGGTLKGLFQMRDGNNADSEHGTVTIANANTIRIEDLAITDLAAFAVADRGSVTIGSYSYHYDSFEIEMTEDGTISSVTFQLAEENNNTSPALMDRLVGKNGVVGASVDAMGVPYYMAQINQFIRTFAKAFNDIERTGETLDGEPMGTFFTAENLVGTVFDYSEQYDAAYDPGSNEATFTDKSNTYYQLTAGTFQVNINSIRDPRYFATTKDVTNGTDAYELITELKKLQADVTMFRGDDAESFLETLLSDISVDTNKSDIFFKNYKNLAASMDQQRKSVAGVDEDEEALDLIRFQNAYNLSSKMISIMTQLYDKLINETGVT